MSLRQKDFGVGSKLNLVRAIVDVSVGLVNANTAEQYFMFDPDRDIVIKDFIIFTRIAVTGGSADLVIRVEDTLNNLIQSFTVPRAAIPATNSILKHIVDTKILKNQTARLDIPVMTGATGTIGILARYYFVDENSSEYNTPGVIL